MFPGLIEGRIVHYVLDSTDPVHKSAVGQHRPAIVVNSWPGLGRDDGYSNLLVFVDGSNDATQFIAHADSPGGQREIPRFMFWATSRVQSEGKAPRTWHMIERTDEKPAAPPAPKSVAEPAKPAPVFDLTPAPRSGAAPAISAEGATTSGTGVAPPVKEEAQAVERMEGEGGKNAEK